MTTYEILQQSHNDLQRELNAAKQRIAGLEARLENQSHNIGVLNFWAETETSFLRNRIAELEKKLKIAEASQKAAEDDAMRNMRTITQMMEDCGAHCAELAALKAAPTPLDRPDAGWQPIETAPKDGTEILGVHDQGRSISTIAFSDGHWRLALWGSYLAKPTHWMPLPVNPPAEPVREGRE